MEKTQKFFRPTIKGIDEEGFSITALVSDQSIDRDKEVILARAWKKGVTDYKKHPVLIAGHSYGDLLRQIGEATKVHPAEDGLETKFKYYVNEGNPEADWAWKLAQKGKAMFSVGFLPTNFSMQGNDDWDDVQEELKKIGVKKPEEVRRVFTEVELLEISQVLVGSNRNALQTLAAKSIESPEGVLAKEILDEMEADLPIYEEDLKDADEWDMALKPYPNEHACRLLDPAGFIRIRRQNDKFGDGIHAIWGVQEGDKPVELQAIRFDKTKHSVAQSKKWLSDHDYKCKMFEPASEKCEICGSPMTWGQKVTGEDDYLPTCNCLIVRGWIEDLKKQWASEFATVKLEIEALKNKGISFFRIDALDTQSFSETLEGKISELKALVNKQPEPAPEGAELLEAVGNLAKKF